MAANCVASMVEGIREVAFHPQRIPRHSKTGLDDFAYFGQNEGETAHICTKNNGRCGSAMLNYRASTPATRVCNGLPNLVSILHRRSFRSLLLNALVSIELANCHSPSTTLSHWKSDLPQCATQPDAAYLKASALVAELLQLIESTPHSYGTPPPAYTEDPDQTPPPYSTSESLACARVEIADSAPPALVGSPQIRGRDLHNAMMDTIDFGDNPGVQSRGKGAKKAAKKAQQAKWLESDNEDGAKNGEDAGNGDGGDAGGGDGGSGAGGGGGDGGGDDNNDDWGFGGGKKNKKNKKSKKQEEEEKKKQEEEEQRKKDEEQAASTSGNGGNFLSWADDANEANAEDDWAGFTTKKDKKKKGKKVISTSSTIRLHSLTPDAGHRYSSRNQYDLSIP